MTHSIVLTNHKGAWFLPYKSTSATNIALGMAGLLRQAGASNPRVLLVDTDTRPSFSLMTEMALIAATDAIVPVEPRYLETVGLLSVMNKINDSKDGWRIPNLQVI